MHLCKNSENIDLHMQMHNYSKPTDNNLNFSSYFISSNVSVDKFQSKMDQTQLNFILEPSQTQTFFSNIVGSGNNWIFLFYNSQTLSFSFLSSFLSDYFKNFHKIAVDSGIYILVYSENNALLFEVYRKSPTSNVTVSLLCNLNHNTDVAEKFLEKDILVRRKDLTGVHLKIGYVPNRSFFFENNEVCNAS
jgi:hypothetical protein